MDEEKIYCSGTDPMTAALLTRDNGFNNPMLLLWAEIFDNNNFSGKMVVDVNVDVDGRVMQFVLEDTSEVGYVGDMVVSINKDAIIREVERVKNQSEDALKMVDYHKEAVGKCESLLKEYSPEFKERTETSERMDSMEKQLAEIGSTLKSLMKNIQNQN